MTITWHTTIAERAILSRFEAGLWPLGGDNYGNGGGWAVFEIGRPGPSGPEEIGYAATYAEARNQAETALRRLAGQETAS